MTEPTILTLLQKAKGRLHFLTQFYNRFMKVLP